MLISSSVSNLCLFAPAPYYKLNKGFILGFLFKPLDGLDAKKRKFVDILEQSLSQTRLCAIFKIRRLVYN